jgi:hypothetical protein
MFSQTAFFRMALAQQVKWTGGYNIALAVRNIFSFNISYQENVVHTKDLF